MLAPFGFVEELVDLAEPDPDASEEDAGKFWTDFIAETAPEFRKPTAEQLASFIQPTYQALIDHGGNNTVTETLHFGKPLIVLPLFWDQYENAQRIDELGFGIRLDTYAFADAELTDAVDRLLADTALRTRLAEIGAGIRARNGLRVGADVIEQVGVQHRASGA